MEFGVGTEEGVFNRSPRNSFMHCGFERVPGKETESVNNYDGSLLDHSELEN